MDVYSSSSIESSSKAPFAKLMRLFFFSGDTFSTSFMSFLDARVPIGEITVSSILSISFPFSGVSKSRLLYFDGVIRYLS